MLAQIPSTHKNKNNFLLISIIKLQKKYKKKLIFIVHRVPNPNTNHTIHYITMPKYATPNIYSSNTAESAGQLCASYLLCGLAALVFTGVMTGLIMSIAVVIDYEETQTFVQHNCTNISNYRIEKWNMFCDRAVAVTMDLTTGLNTTLYYPPIETWIPWKQSSARAWFLHLANLTTPFPCYIDYPKQIGITGVLSSITTYYIVCSLSFLLLLVGVCVLCRYRSNRYRHRGYYTMN
jgi:hypothetical protein